MIRPSSFSHTLKNPHTQTPVFLANHLLLCYSIPRRDGLWQRKGRVEAIGLMAGNMNLTFVQVMDVFKMGPSERDRLASLLS